MIVDLTALLADATEPARGPAAGMDMIIFLIAPLALFLLFIVMPMKREARVRRDMLGTLKKGDRVLINGFMIGNVVQIIKPDNQPGEDELLVKVDDNANIKLRVLRGSITRILKSEESTAKEGA